MSLISCLVNRLEFRNTALLASISARTKLIIGLAYTIWSVCPMPGMPYGLHFCQMIATHLVRKANKVDTMRGQLRLEMSPCVQIM